MDGYPIGVCSASLIYQFISPAKFVEFSTIISSSTFSSLTFHPAFQDSTDRSIQSLVIVLQVSKPLFIFSVYFTLFRLDCFYCSIFQFIGTFFCHLHSAVKSIFGDFYFGYFSILKFSLGFFLYFLFFYEAFLFLFVSHIHNCSLKHFCNDCFKIFVICLMVTKYYHQNH